ncbi:MAG TPA: hypothetical protein PKE64_28685, partial [Anaerolineae bacterium]|nr:hypothetical protein [Anaerolineae bacterium]
NDADGNGDSVVNAADYVVWRDRQSVSAAATLSVPEPAAGLMAIVFTLFFITGARRPTCH